MSRFNTGIIFTNNHCNACNKCISHCGIFGANVSSVQDGKALVQIDSSRCVVCGRCVNNCHRDAREYRDNTLEFLEALQRGENISLIIDPSFEIMYRKQFSKILQFLKSLGIKKIYDGGMGYELSMWAQIKYVKEHKDDDESKRRFIANICSAGIRGIASKFPNLLQQVIPVASPLLSNAIYVKQYKNDVNKIAYLGPCVSKIAECKEDMDSYGISYVLTFDKFIKQIKGKYENLSDENITYDEKSLGLGVLLDLKGGFKEILSYFFSPYEFIMEFEGLSERTCRLLQNQINANKKNNKPVMAIINTCATNCLEGSGVNIKSFDHSKVYGEFIKLRSELYKRFASGKSLEANYIDFINQFSEFEVNDFTYYMTDRFKQAYKVPESIIQDIFISMLKDTQEKQKMDCANCGYSTCRQMAEAIAYGYNQKENCIHYMKDQMERSYLIDSVTGLDNQNAFVQKVQKLIEQRDLKDYLFVYGDINRFKVLDDINGYDVGDSILKLVAITLQNFVGEDGACARFSGGNFAMCFENSMEKLTKFYELQNFDCTSIGVNAPVTMRFGIYIPQGQYEDINKMVMFASLAMNMNASSVRNTYNLFTQELRERTLKEVEITSQMQKALEDGEFCLWYQPQYLTSNGHMVGAETLCRWIKQDGTMIPPTVFINLAEKNGFIKLLDKEIWTMAFKQIHQWLEEGLNIVPISLNISRISLQTDELIFSIKRLMNVYNVPPELVHFEITESAYMSEQNKLIDRVNEIRKLGFKIAMDDFGSGYSSLNTLKDLPMDYIKLDMGFLRDSNMDKGGTIISSVVRMSQELNLITIAEGVEQTGQANFLRSIGCDIIQGFLFSKPMSADKFVAMLESNSTVQIVDNSYVYGKIAAENFYTPDSSENLMFENYTGPAAIFEYDLQSKEIRLLRTNHRCLSLFGLQYKDFRRIRKSLKESFSKVSRDEFRKAAEKVVLEHVETTCITENRNFETGVPVWVRSNLLEISKNTNRVIIYDLLEDITEEKITESTMTITNKQLSTLLNKSRVGMCLFHVNLDLKNILNSVHARVLKTNDVFLELTGFSREEVLSWTEREILNAIHPLDRPLFIAKAVKAAVGNFKKECTFMYRTKVSNGKYKSIRIFISGERQEDGSFIVVTNFSSTEDAIEEESISFP